jgi:lysozyme
MQPSTKAYDIIRKFEASDKCRLKAYLDTGGVPTIGWGTTAYPDGKKVKMGDVCTKEQADEWLIHDVDSSVKSISKLVKVKISQSMFDALVSFVYNLGAGKLSSSTLLKLLNAGKFEEAAAQFARWKFDNGQVQPGLVKRRSAEEALFREGIRELQKG